MSRTDDIINVAGHRLCTGAIEGVIQDDEDIAECAVVILDVIKFCGDMFLNGTLIRLELLMLLKDMSQLH